MSIYLMGIMTTLLAPFTESFRLGYDGFCKSKPFATEFVFILGDFCSQHIP